MKVFVSGPMSGYPEFNVPRFQTVVADLKAHGYDAVSILDVLDGDHIHGSLDWGHYTRKAIVLLIECDAIFMLHGWWFSKGANLEHTIARALGMTILDPEAMRAATAVPGAN